MKEQPFEWKEDSSLQWRIQHWKNSGDLSLTCHASQQEMDNFKVLDRSRFTIICQKVQFMTDGLFTIQAALCN